jgi:hypothetical protein
LGEEEEYTLGKSFMERNKSIGGQTTRLPVVVAVKERERRGRKKGGRKKSSTQNIMYQKGASEATAMPPTVALLLRP